MDNTLRTLAPLRRERGEGIVRPVSKEMELLSRRLHHSHAAGDAHRRHFFAYDRGMAAIQVRHLSAEQAAYIAGLIDGEGTVTLTREHRGETRRLVVSISNTEASLLEFVAESTGVGKITRKRTASPAHTPSFAYRVTSRQALVLLSQIEPYLRSYKRERARFALAHYVSVTPRNGKYLDSLAEQRVRFETDLLGIVQSRADGREVMEPSIEYEIDGASSLTNGELLSLRRGARASPLSANTAIAISCR